MSIKKENATIVGFGAAACVACCIGAILGFLAAIGIGTAAGLALFGTISLVEHAHAGWPLSSLLIAGADRGHNPRREIGRRGDPHTECLASTIH